MKKLAERQVRGMVRMLVAPSAISVAMILARFVYVADLRFRFCGLLLNLFLAWIPMALALLIWRTSPGRRLAWCGLFVAWLLFFPNSFYLTTDLIHTQRFGTDGVFRWYDIIMTVCFAATGLFLGSLSLYLLHSIVRAHLGRSVGWIFAGTILALCSFGIYLGRFLRFNSWDVITKPRVLFDGVVVLGESNGTEVAVFCGAFFMLSILVYGFVFSVAHLGENAEAGNSDPRTAATFHG